MKLFGKKNKEKDTNAEPEKDEAGRKDSDPRETSVGPTHSSEGCESFTGKDTCAVADDPVSEPASPKKGFFGRFKRQRKAKDVEADPDQAAADARDRGEDMPRTPQDLPASPESFSETDICPGEEKRGFWNRFVKEDIPEESVAVSETSRRVAEGDPAEEPHEQSAESDEENGGPEESEKRGFFKRLRTRLTKTRKAFVNRVDDLLLGKKEIDEELLDELEEILITSDIGVHTSTRLIEAVREKVERKDLDSPAQLRQALQAEIESFLQVKPPYPPVDHHKPYVIMVVGVNGVGKTTTIGKLAARYMKADKQVLLVAADTFRAAAVEQLQIWSERIGCDIVKHTGKADPSAVAYDGIQAAKSRETDVVIIDTAGRLHTKANLMEELKKIRRTVAGQLSEAPHEVLLVLDATTGQNAISQAELFNEALELNSIALTKLDGTAKGGVVVGICERLGIPLKYIGIGEKIDDLQTFDADEFIKALF